MLNANVFRSVTISKPKSTFSLLPASEFSFKELTDIYNQTRTDYIVPMPMSEAKLREYVHNYDVDLEHSVVSISKNVPFGLGMLGVRGNTTWITRLGITPNGRKKGVGRAMMNELLTKSQEIKGKTVILEVIKKNKPARHLFGSLGFQILRDLLVIRRPPKPVSEFVSTKLNIDKVGHETVVDLLNSRPDLASWVTANESMFNAGKLSALVANDGSGWLVYQNTPFQLSRVVLETAAAAPLEVAIALLQDLHKRHPFQDTVVENLAADDKNWPAFQALDYITSFVRVEMNLDLTSKTFARSGYTIPLPKTNSMPVRLLH